MKIYSAEIQNLPYDELGTLFFNYYSELQRMNAPHTLAEKGEKMWVESVKKSLGKTSVLILVKDDKDELVGFGFGQLKLGPDYLGNKRVGTVAHFYIKEAFRGKKISHEIFQKMKKWFLEKKAESIELEVIQENEIALAFWQKMGFQTELKQLRMKL